MRPKTQLLFCFLFFTKKNVKRKKCRPNSEERPHKLAVAACDCNFLGLWAAFGCDSEGVYHVMVSTVEPLPGQDSKLLFSDQFCSSSHNDCCYDSRWRDSFRTSTTLSPGRPWTAANPPSDDTNRHSCVLFCLSCIITPITSLPTGGFCMSWKSLFFCLFFFKYEFLWVLAF